MILELWGSEKITPGDIAIKDNCPFSTPRFDNFSSCCQTRISLRTACVWMWNVFGFFCIDKSSKQLYTINMVNLITISVRQDDKQFFVQNYYSIHFLVLSRPQDLQWTVSPTEKLLILLCACPKYQEGPERSLIALC